MKCKRCGSEIYKIAFVRTKIISTKHLILYYVTQKNPECKYYELVNKSYKGYTIRLNKKVLIELKKILNEVV